MVKGRARVNQFLRLLFWESTIKCNLTCAHCRRLESDDAMGTDLSTNQAKMLIEELAEFGAKQPMMPVMVFSGGEPLCRHDLFDLIEYARSKKIVPALATNATLIDAKIAQQIADSAIARVAVSLDGAEAKVHDKLRQLEGSFGKAIEGIKNLHENQVPFQINITLTKNNADQLEKVYELSGYLGAVALHIFMLVPVGCGQVLAQTDMLSPLEYEQMLVKILKLDSRKELEIKVTCGPHYERILRQHRLHKKDKAAYRGCLAGLGVLFVAHNGDVFPCGYLPVKCGNILQNSLSQIWYNSDDLARMRDADELEGKCGICGYRQVCGGCRARAYATTGNYMAEEPFCAYVPPEAVH